MAISSVAGHMVALLCISLSGCKVAPSQPLSPPKPFSGTEICHMAADRAAQPVSESALDILANQTGRTGDEIAEAILVSAAFEIAEQAGDEASCLNIIAEGEALFRSVLDVHQNTLMKSGGYKPSDDTDISAVQSQITLLWREDQSARQTYIDLSSKDQGGAAYWADQRAAAHTVWQDGKSADTMTQLLKTYDWIDIDRFGEKVSAHAWLLVQHADDRPELQALALERMQPYLETDGIRKANYAYLWDRVAVNAGRKQLYGTQPTWICTDGSLQLEPLQDPETVNDRRAVFGMNTVEDGLAAMARDVCR